MIHDEAVTSVPAEDDKCSLIDWEALRRRSLQPGGFGDDRVDLWCVNMLYHAAPACE